jgi:hypothetical protein
MHKYIYIERERRSKGKKQMNAAHTCVNHHRTSVVGRHATAMPMALVGGNRGGN